MPSEYVPRHANENSLEQYRKERRKFFAQFAGIFALNALVYGVITVASDDAAMDNIKAANSRSPINNEMSELASYLADDSIRVDCNDEVLDANEPRVAASEDNPRYETLGMVRNPNNNIPFMPGVITLREGICEAIITFDATAPNDAYNSPDYQHYLGQVDAYATGLGTLLHEIEHTDGIMNEAQADCYAYQKLPAALETLGIAPADALDSSHMVASLDGPLRPDEYISEECRPGGEYDLAVSDVYINENS